MRATVIAAVFVAATTGQAHAATPQVTGTSCGLAAVIEFSGQLGNPTSLEGVEAATAATVSGTVDVTCDLYADGTLYDRQTSLPGQASALVAPLSIIQPPTNDSEYRLCTTVRRVQPGGATSVPYAACVTATVSQVPPQVVCDVAGRDCSHSPLVLTVTPAAFGE